MSALPCDYPMMHVMYLPPSPRHKQTNAYENITFPQLRLRAVNILSGFERHIPIPVQRPKCRLLRIADTHQIRLGVLAVHYVTS